MTKPILADLLKQVENITNRTEQEQIELAKKNPFFPSEDLYKFSETVQIELVKQNYAKIYSLKNPTEKVIHEAVKQHWQIVHYITQTLSIQNINEETQLAAVKQDWRALYFINNPTEKVIYEAEKHGDKAIEYIKYSNIKKAQHNTKKTKNLLKFSIILLGFFIFLFFALYFIKFTLFIIGISLVGNFIVYLIKK